MLLGFQAPMLYELCYLCSGFDCGHSQTKVFLQPEPSMAGKSNFDGG